MKHYIRAYGETQSKRGVFGLIEGGVLIKRVLSVVLNGLLSTVLKPTRRGERPVLHTPTVCGRDGERRGFRHTDDTNRCLIWNIKLNLFTNENIKITFLIGCLLLSLLCVYKCSCLCMCVIFSYIVCFPCMFVRMVTFNQVCCTK